MLKATLFLPNSFWQMALTDVRRAEDPAGIDYAPLCRRRLQLVVCTSLVVICGTHVFAQLPSDNAVDLAKYAMKLPESSLVRIEPKVPRPLVNSRFQISGLSEEAGSAISQRNTLGIGSGDYAWRLGIATTVFWVGEQACPSNPLSNEKSAWDSSWISSYGGTDTPVSEERLNFAPLRFVPRQNPFYIALPYNDVDDHHTKPEAAQVIPWYQSSFVRDGQSVCKGRWVAIRHGTKVCYAQWEDVGPFRTDHWQYVFGDERPRPNRNRDAGLDVSPAVRDYLALDNIDFCDWKFVDFVQVPSGPWAMYGDNNIFSRLHRSKSTASTVNHRVSPEF
jgi:hypothetical protein